MTRYLIVFTDGTYYSTDRMCPPTAAHAACYKTEEEAARVAVNVGGSVQQVTVAISGKITPVAKVIPFVTA